MDSSRFFSIPSSGLPNGGFTAIEEYYTSPNGACRLLRAQREGKWHILKTLKAEYRHDTAYAERLRKEFEIGYMLDHPNIVRTLDFIELEGYGQVIVLEWIDGVTLDQVALDKSNAPKIVAELCSAVAYIHSKQVVHRDLKPQNILVTHNGQNVKLIDFGLSDADHYALWKEPGGTLLYAAPELVQGEASDCRADIYSVGVLFRIFFSRWVSHRAIRCATNPIPDNRYGSIEAFLRDLTHRKGRAVGFWLAGVAIAVVAVGLWYYFDRQPTVPFTPIMPIVSLSIDTIKKPIEQAKSNTNTLKKVEKPIEEQVVSLPSIDADLDRFERLIQQNHVYHSQRISYLIDDVLKQKLRQAERIYEPAVDFSKDSLLFAKQITAYIDSLFVEFPRSGLRKVFLSGFLDCLRYDIQYARSRYWSDRRHAVLMAFKKAKDPIADSLRNLHPIPDIKQMIARDEQIYWIWYTKKFPHTAHVI